MPSIRRVPNTPVALGIFQASGSLRDARRRRDPVRELRVGRGAKTLEALVGFPDLRILDLARTEPVDLSPLASSRVEQLDCEELRGFDLAPLAEIATLRSLSLSNSRDSRIPTTLRLPASLQELLLRSDGFDDVPRIVAAIDFGALPALERLTVVGDDLGSTRADLSFIRSLSALRGLRVWQIRHQGAGNSPVDPPYEGLPRGLRGVSIEAFEPSAARAELRRLFPDAEMRVRRRYQAPTETPAGAWTVDGDDGEWGTYGSLCELPAFRACEVEHDAAVAAEEMIREADPRLAARLELDQESDGTGITAPTRDELERALRIIGALR